MEKEWSVFDDKTEILWGIVVQKYLKEYSILVYAECQNNKFIEITENFRLLPLDYDIPGITLKPGDAVEVKGKGQSYGGVNNAGVYDGWRFNCLPEAEGYLKKLDIPTTDMLRKIYEKTDNEIIQNKIRKIIGK